MSNKDIYDQLTSIQSRLNEGIQIIAVDETNKKTPIKITASNSNTKDDTGQYVGNLNVNADFSGSVKLNNETSNILIYGQNYANKKNYPVSIETNGDVSVKDTGANSSLSSIDAKLTSVGTKLQVEDTAVNTKLQTIIDNLEIIITPPRYGSHNNVHNGNLLAGASSTALNVSSYKKAVISYNDASHALNNTLQIVASADATDENTGNYDYIGLLIPVTNTTASKRYASAILELSPFKYLKITNLSGDNISGISCSLYGSG